MCQRILATDVNNVYFAFVLLSVHMSTLDYCVCVIEFCGFFARAYLLTGNWEQLKFFLLSM